MSIEKARALLQEALVELQDAPPTGQQIAVTAGSNLQSIIDTAPEGAVLNLEPATYSGVFTFTKFLVLRPKVDIPTGRRTKTFNPVTLMGGQDVTTIHTKPATNGPTLIGLTIKSTNPDNSLVTDEAKGTRIDRCAVLGDPVKGMHRGIIPHGQGTVIVQSLVDDCFAVARDTQAIGGWDGTDGLLVQDCYLSAGAETVMFGGATSAAPERNPKNIAIQRCTLTKNPAWLTMDGVSIKNALELKNCHDVVVQDCIMEYAGISGGQGGYVVVITVRNQDGDTPFAQVANVTIDRCIGRHALGAFNIMGDDNIHPSLRTNGVYITRNLFYDLKTGRTNLITRGPVKVEYHHNTFVGDQMNTFLALDDQPKTDGLVMLDNVFPEGEYGMHGSDTGLGVPAWTTFTQNSRFESNIIARGTSGRNITYPGTSNFLTGAGQDAVDRKTMKLSAIVKNGTDGKPIGCDPDDVLAATGATL
jgi:hypothetical protein